MSTSITTWIKRYLKTWKCLLIAPGAFIHLSIEKRRTEYIGPLKFFALSATFIYGLGLVCKYAWWQVLDAQAPLPNFVTIIRGVVSGRNWITAPYILATMIQACLWYVVLHRWLKHKWSVRTTQPYKRILHELFYLNGGPLSVALTIASLFSIILVALVGLLLLSRWNFKTIHGDILSVCLPASLSDAITRRM